MSPEKDPPGFAHKIELVTVGELPLRLKTAPPMFPTKVQFVTIGLTSLFRIAPPSGALFPTNRELLNIGTPVSVALPT
jgi:hypothetical protein